VRRFPDTHVVDTPRSDKLLRQLSSIARFGFLPSREQIIARRYSRLINDELEKIRPDVVVVIGAAHKVAYLDEKWPMVYMADAMFGTVVQYYTKYLKLNDRALRSGNLLQRELISRADIIMLTSDWAAESAAAEYGLSRDRFSIVPMGANLDRDPGFCEPVVGGPIKLLFIGYDWKRKGGDLAYSVWRELRRQTGDAELHIVGCSPAKARGQAGVHLHGVLRKSDPEQNERLNAVYRHSSFLFMPSRQETFGLVYCEAAAFGRPSIGAATGGVPTVVRDGETGILLPRDATTEDYVERISALWADPSAYRRMCQTARDAYVTRLNWSAWGDVLSRLVHHARAGHRAQSLTST
jgi:glycosyltransferase involved in cell wall biosynthesis